MLRVNINLFEVSDGGLEDPNVRKPYGNIIFKSDPQMAVTLRRFEDFMFGHLGENGLRRVTRKECGRGELYRW